MTRPLSRAYAEMQVQSQFPCQCWKQGEKNLGSLVYPDMALNTKIFFNVPMYFTCALGIALRDRDGLNRLHYVVTETNKPMRLKNVSDELRSHLLPLYDEVEKDWIIGDFYILGAGRNRRFSDGFVEKIGEWLGVWDRPAAWEADNERVA